jgi:hypothetical protein
MTTIGSWEFFSSLDARPRAHGASAGERSHRRTGRSDLWTLNAGCGKASDSLEVRDAKESEESEGQMVRNFQSGSPVDVFSGTEIQASHRRLDSRQLLPRFSMGVICPTHHGSLLFAGSMEFARSTQARSAVLIGWLSGRPKRSGALSRDVRGLSHTSAAGFTTRLYIIYI